MRLLLLTLALALAEASATQALKARDAEVRAAVPAKGAELTPATRQKLENILTRAVDLEGVARASLGKNWDKATPAQRKRFLDRVNKPDKHWKFSPDDIHERKFWDKYMEAYEGCLTQTSTDWAPWYIVPADQKWVTRTLVASIVAQAIGGLRLEYPRITKQQRKEIKEAKKQLLREGE